MISSAKSKSGGPALGFGRGGAFFVGRVAGVIVEHGGAMNYPFASHFVQAGDLKA
jgi:hypothetical protein